METEGVNEVCGVLGAGLNEGIGAIHLGPELGLDGE